MPKILSIEKVKEIERTIQNNTAIDINATETILDLITTIKELTKYEGCKKYGCICEKCSAENCDRRTEEYIEDHCEIYGSDIIMSKCHICERKHCGMRNKPYGG